VLNLASCWMFRRGMARDASVSPVRMYIQERNAEYPRGAQPLAVERVRRPAMYPANSAVVRYHSRSRYLYGFPPTGPFMRSTHCHCTFVAEVSIPTFPGLEDKVGVCGVDLIEA
jgi:hypothetical protein